MIEVNEYKKNHEYLLCIDSDGCAIDSMEIKHKKCFGPKLIEEWELYEWESDINFMWNDLNLYSTNRGINRFKGLGMILEKINAIYKPIEGIYELLEWINTSKYLSEGALKEVIDFSPDKLIFKKALNWSEDVNKCIDELKDTEKPAFLGVKETLEIAKHFADIVIVSSANRKAVIEEWNYAGLLDKVNMIMAQDMGTKEKCINKIVSLGYDNKKVIMLGDSIGDYKAANKNKVSFYPIVVGKEKESWIELRDNILNLFFTGAYDSTKQDIFYDNFIKILA